jgi:hypothetical protein
MAQAFEDQACAFSKETRHVPSSYLRIVITLLEPWPQRKTPSWLNLSHSQHPVQLMNDSPYSRQQSNEFPSLRAWQDSTKTRTRLLPLRPSESYTERPPRCATSTRRWSAARATSFVLQPRIYGQDRPKRSASDRSTARWQRCPSA